MCIRDRADNDLRVNQPASYEIDRCMVKVINTHQSKAVGNFPFRSMAAWDLHSTTR